MGIFHHLYVDSNWAIKNNWLFNVYIGDYTTRLYGDDNKPLYKDPYETTSISMESKAV